MFFDLLVSVSLGPLRSLGFVSCKISLSIFFSLSNFFKMAKSSKSSRAIQSTIFDDVNPLTITQLVSEVGVDIENAEVALQKLRALHNRLVAMQSNNDDVLYNFNFFSPITVNTALQLQILV